MESITNNNQGEQTEETTAHIIHVWHLLDYLRRVKDGRKRRGIRYRLEIILALFILAKLCGENKVYGIADWVRLRQNH